MLGIVKRIVSGRFFGGLSVGTQRYFEYVWHLVPHWDSSSGEKRQLFGAKALFVHIVHSVFDHKDPHENAYDCCRLKRAWRV